MNLTEAISTFFASDTGQIAAAVLLLPVLDWALGTLAALRDGTFQLDSLAAFLRKHVAGRILPIWALLFVGYFTTSISLPVVGWPALQAVGLAAAGLYIAETIGSILRSWGPQAPAGEAPTLLNRDPVQPRPTD